MLTKEILQSNEILKELSDDQLGAIAELSKNDENATISKHRGEWWSALDNDIKTITGITKPDGKKSHEFLKEQLTDLKNKAAGAGEDGELSKQLEKLRTENAEMKAKIKEGAGAETLKSEIDRLTQALQDKDTRINQLVKKSKDDADTWKKQLNKKEQEKVEIQINNEFDSALVGKKYKRGIDSQIIELAIKESKKAVLNSFQAEYIDNGQGGRTLVFRGEDGEILNNPENQLRPYTPGEMLMRQELMKKVLDTAKSQNGAGTGSTGQTGAAHRIDLSAVSTKMEANDMISKHIMSLGIAKTDPRYAEEFKKVYDEHQPEITKLPLR